MHAKSDSPPRSATARRWNILVVLSLAALLPLVGCRKKPVARKVATPIPSTPIPATPTPVVVKATPEPTPMPVVVATPTPAPTPPPLDLATVTQTPTLWPMQVALTAPHSFPIVIGGRAAGEVKMPPGTALKLLRVLGPQLQVEYQGNLHVVPTASTDLMPRALAISKNPALARPTPPPAPVFVPGTVVTPVPVTELPAAAIAQRVTVDVARVKRSRNEVTDPADKKDDKKDKKDDKTDTKKADRRNDNEESIELRVRLTNTDSNRAAKRLKGEIFIFADSLADRSAIKLLGTHPIDCSIPARGFHEIITPEINTMFWTTGRYGFKYDGWFLRVRNSEGKDVLLKSNSPTLLRNADKIDSLAVGKTYERSTFKPKDVPR